jgi:hypothetical protein
MPGGKDATPQQAKGRRKEGRGRGAASQVLPRPARGQVPEALMIDTREEGLSFDDGYEIGLEQGKQLNTRVGYLIGFVVGAGFVLLALLWCGVL